MILTGASVVATSITGNIAEVILQVTGKWIGRPDPLSDGYLPTFPCGKIADEPGIIQTVERAFLYKKYDTGWRLMDTAYSVKRIR